MKTLTAKTNNNSDMMYVINGSRMHPEFMASDPKDWLLTDAKSYGLKGLSKMNRRQLATAILEHLVKQEGNYMSPKDEFERECLS